MEDRAPLAFTLFVVLVMGNLGFSLAIMLGFDIWASLAAYSVVGGLTVLAAAVLRVLCLVIAQLRPRYLADLPERRRRSVS